MSIKNQQSIKSKTSAYDAFINHASEDTEWCKKLLERLQGHGLKSLV